MLAASINTQNELLQQIAEGNEKAFRNLFDRYWDRIYSVAFTLTKSAHLAEELTQDTFLKIWLKRQQLPSIENFEGFLYTVARNHIYNALRTKVVELPFVEHLEQHFQESSAVPEQVIFLKETNQRIKKAIEHLPTQQRIVFELSRNEGLDNNTIAEQLGISRSTVKNHLTKALSFLRSYLHVGSGELSILLLAYLIKNLS